MDDSVEYQGPGEVGIRLDGAWRLRGTVGLVVLGDGTCLSPLAQPHATCRSDAAETPGGPADCLHLAGRSGDGLSVTMTFALYRAAPALEIGMSVSNESDRDVVLERIVYLRALPPHGGFGPERPRPGPCRFLEQPWYWPGHFDVRNYLRDVPPGGSATAYWSTVIGASGQPSLAIGIGETARGGAEITLHGGEDRVGLEVAVPLRTSRQGRLLRLPPGATFASHRMTLVPGPDPLAALDAYAQFVCDRMRWKLRFPPYSGLFAAYGSDPGNGDPQSVSLSEARLATLMDVVDRHLRPYGLDTIKTQFHGLSSSRPDGKPVTRLSAEKAKDPAAVRKLVTDIRDRAFAPDDYDSRRDFPHGLGWHVRQLAARGYRPALVCRPFYNICAGTPELDRAAADLFEMAVHDWGYRYLMLDFISADYDSADADTLTMEQGIFNRFRAIRERVGPDVFIEACMVWPGPVLGVADGYRPAHDWRGGLEEDLAPTFACRYHYHGRFFQCDDEFFDPARRPFTWGSQGRQGMYATLDRVRLWVSFNAMLGYSYLTGGALERVEPDRWWAYQRGLPAQEGRVRAVDFFESSPPSRWVRRCATPAGEHIVLGIFNWSKADALSTPIAPADFGLPADEDYVFFDFWAQEVYGPARSLPCWIAPFSCRVLQVHPVPSEPALIGSSRHVTGQVGIERWEWSAGEAALDGAFSGAPGSREHYWIWLPGNEGVAACQGAALEVIRPRVIRLSITFDATGRQDWRIQLDRGIPVP